MKVEKHEMTIKEFGSIILNTLTIVLFIVITIAPFLWLLGII